MRNTPPIPIRRVLRGTDYSRKPFNPQNYPVSPSIENLLSQPTWSVRTLLPPSSKPSSSTDPNTPTNNDAPTEELTIPKLHHLLRLSALPLPKTPSAQTQMLQTLRSQIHFVRAIQSVDTTGVTPLVTVCDETREAVAENTITLEKMLPYLELEEKVGRNGTVRRRDVARTEEEDRAERGSWEVDVAELGVGSAERMKGRWFFVRRGTERGEKNGEVEVEREGKGEGENT